MYFLSIIVCKCKIFRAEIFQANRKKNVIYRAELYDVAEIWNIENMTSSHGGKQDFLAIRYITPTVLVGARIVEGKIVQK